MKNCKFFYLLIMAGSLVILSAACQANADATDVTNVKVYTALPKRTIIDTEEIPISNCDGNIETIQTLGSIKTTQMTSEVDTVAVNSEGSEYEIPETLKLQLEIEIENSYQQPYQNAIARLENASMNAAPGFETVYVINWEQLDYRGDVHYSIGGLVYKVHYLYQLIVPKLLTKEEIDCDGNIQSVTLSPQALVSTITPPALTPLAPTLYTLTLRTKTYLYIGPQMAYGTVDLKRRLKGEEFSVVAKNPIGDWFLVQESDGTQGWLYAKWVKIIFDPELIPVTTDFPPAPTPTAKPTRRPKPPQSYP